MEKSWIYHDAVFYEQETEVIPEIPYYCRECGKKLIQGKTVVHRYDHYTGKPSFKTTYDCPKIEELLKNHIKEFKLPRAVRIFNFFTKELF